MYVPGTCIQQHQVVLVVHVFTHQIIAAVRSTMEVNKQQQRSDSTNKHTLKYALPSLDSGNTRRSSGLDVVNIPFSIPADTICKPWACTALALVLPRTGAFALAQLLI